MAVLSALVTFFEAGKMIDYRIMEFIADMLKPVIASIIMGVTIFFAEMVIRRQFGICSNAILLISKMMIGVVIYYAFSVLLKIKGYYEILNVVKNMRKKNG